MFSEALGIVCELDIALAVVFGAVAAEFIIVIGGDMAVALGGSRFGMGVWGTSRGELGRLGGVLDCRWGLLGWQSHFVE